MNVRSAFTAPLMMSCTTLSGNGFCIAPRYEYFPNPGDPDYVPYKERNPGNKNEWEPKKRYMDKITKDWLREQEDKWKEQKIKETY